MTDKSVITPRGEERRKERETETQTDINCGGQKKERNGRKETDGYFPRSVCSGNVMCDCLTLVPNLCSVSPDEKYQIEAEGYAYKIGLSS